MMVLTFETLSKIAILNEKSIERERELQKHVKYLHLGPKKDKKAFLTFCDLRLKGFLHAKRLRRFLHAIVVQKLHVETVYCR